ncbi:MAG: glycine--tRNA ligase subunit beta [Chlamydiales bacterium]
MMNFQEMILNLTRFWASKGCLIHQGYDLETGAGTFNPATFLRCLGPEPYSAVYIEPSRRPKDGRYGDNPNRIQSYHQMQVIIKPAPSEIQNLYLDSLRAIELDLREHDIRFVQDDWENPTIGAWGLGWEVWADGMEITQFTYFQSVGGLPVKPVSVELTYGLERLALYIQGVDSFFDLKWNDEITYGEIFRRNEWEWSHYNFTRADPAMWLRHFEDFEGEATRLIQHDLPIPAYDFVMKASHTFNILDARGVISVTERTGYIGRIRSLARAIAELYIKSREKQSFPLLKKQTEEIRPPLFPCTKKYDLRIEQDFLLEIGSEELPAGFVEIGLRSLKSKIAEFLQQNALVFHTIETYGTPRRLAVVVRKLISETSPKPIVRKGPSVKFAFDIHGKPTQIGQGFFSSIQISVTSLEQIKNREVAEVSIQSIKNEDYLFVNIQPPIQSTALLLAQALPSLILKTSFPKMMRWDQSNIEYPRPIRWIVALYGEEKISFSIGEISSGKLSFGHRQLDPAPFTISFATTYLETLKSHMVMVSIEERKQSILTQIKNLTSEGKIVAQEDLLSELVHLVEWPFVIKSSFDHKFLQAPKEVLICELVEHQKYFPIESTEGKLTSEFLIVCDNRPTDLIQKGNQRALSPRLADGVFLYEEDLKTSLDHLNDKLRKMTFQKQLGSVWEKVERLKKITTILHNSLPICNIRDLHRAAELSKSDLASLLVGEFPSLQGHIGAIYALKQGETEMVASAIKEHWMPTGEKSILPKTPCGVLLSLADKMDNLMSCFIIGLKPTSSSDPYALRRQGSGLLKIMIQQKLHFLLNQIFDEIVKLFPTTQENLLQEIEIFLIHRFRTILHEEGYPNDAIEAVLAKGLNDCYDIYRKIQALHDVRKSEGSTFSSILKTYMRVKKILFTQNPQLLLPSQARDKSLTTHFPKVNPTLFEDPTEKGLYQVTIDIKKTFEKELFHPSRSKDKDYSTAFLLLSHFEKPVENLFEKIKILTDSSSIRVNRLAILQEIWDLYESLIAFDKIQESEK